MGGVGVTGHYRDDMLALQQTASFIGGPAFRAVVVGLLSFGLVARRRVQSAVLLVVSVLGASLINNLVKRIVARQRPSPLLGIRQAGGYSFPSGHALGSLVFFGVLAYLVWHVTRRPRLTLAAALASVIVTALVGYSRVALRQHHTGDVLSGYGLGAAWLVLILRAFSGPLRAERAGGP